MPAPGVTFDILAWSYYDTAGEKPSLDQVPALLRRRASVADRMALKVAFDAWPGPESIATVFCSRRGENHRSVELLNLMAAGEGQSPMSFSLSVHNAASGLFGIARADKAASSSLSGGKESLAMGIFEASGLLAGGKEKVLLVNYDDASPEILAGFVDEAERPFALALLLTKGSGYQLEKDLSEPIDDRAGAPQGVRFAEFLKSKALELRSNQWRFARTQEKAAHG